MSWKKKTRCRYAWDTKSGWEMVTRWHERGWQDLGEDGVFWSMIWNLNFIVTAAAAAKSLQLCPTLCDPIDSSPPGSHPWDSVGENTGVGCHFLLQCMKVKSESEVTQSCPTLSNPTGCSLPGSSVHGIFQARVLELVAIAFSVRFFLLYFQYYSGHKTGIIL